MRKVSGMNHQGMVKGLVAHWLILVALLACNGDRPGETLSSVVNVHSPCSDIDCLPRDVSVIDLFSVTVSSSVAAYSPVETPSVEDALEKGLRLAGASPTHIAFRGTAQEGSVRCGWRGIARTPSQREQAIRFWLKLDADAALPSASAAERLFLDELDAINPVYPGTVVSNFIALARGSLSTEYMFLTCHADYTVHEFLLGSGATGDTSKLTVSYDRMGEERSYDLYRLSHGAGEFGTEELLERGEYEDDLSLRVEAAEALLSVIMEGRESVVFLAPMGAHNAIATETWLAVAQWDLQTSETSSDSGSDTSTTPTPDSTPETDSDSESGTSIVMAVRYGTAEGDPEHAQTLANLKSRIMAAAASDDFVNARIANVSGLTQYYRDIGAYGDITPDDGSTATFTPAQPPPALECAVGTAVTDATADRALVHDCEALLASKDTLRGTATLDWSVDSAITGWEGVTVAGTPSRVTKLLLSSESLDGTIPSELGSLFELTHLNLSSNSLTGNIPRELGLLYNLQEIRLSGNSLTGCIPVALKDVLTNDLSSLNLLYCSPPAPTGLAAGTTTETSVSLSWTAVSNTSKYRVEYRPLYSADWVVDDDTLTVTSRAVEGLSCGSEYLFRVSAYGSGTTYAAAWSEPSGYLMSTGGECVPPTFETTSYDFSVPADAELGAVVGNVSATGSLTNDVVTYTITGGDEDGNFAIDESTGQITVAGDLSSSVGTSFTLTLEASDTSGGSATVVATIDVTKTCSSGTAVPSPGSNPGLVADCRTLLGLQSTLAGTATLNWSADRAMSTWEGVTLRGTPQRVTRLLLERKGLTGSIPEAIGDLAGLRDLELGRNQLTGSIPGSLGRLINLRDLELEANRLTGPIPAELGALTNLVFLHLYNNSLSGPIPSEIGSLTSVYDLFLQNNALTGPIPPEMGNMAELGRLWLSGNQLSGTIPAELTELTRLTLLLLHGNPIVGCLPPSLKDIATNDLNTLRLRDCLDGPPAPTGLSTSLADDAFTVTWTAISGVDEYEVQWRIAGSGDSWAALPAVTTVSATYVPTGGPECSSTYEFRVRAHGDGFTYPTHWGTESGSESAATSSCPPAFVEVSYAFEVSEDASVNHTVGMVSATDPDEDDEVSYSITAGNGDGKFNIDDGTGAITVAASLDHETADEYTLTVEADDGNGATSTVTVTVTVTDVAEDPFFDEASYAFEVSEDASVNHTVGTVSATDPDEDDEVSYSITAGNGDGKIAIGDGTGEITVAASLDHETADEYTLTVEASDGQNGTATVTVMVTVTDVAEDPSFDEVSYAFEVAEDAVVGYAVGTVSATDPDEDDEVSYSITAGDGDGKIAIDDGTGAITVAAALDHETTDAYTLTVEASDGQNGTATVAVMVSVTDVAEDPSFDEASYAFDVAEDASVNHTVGTVSATDPDEDDEVSYAITAGNGDGKFNIGDGTGEITVAASLDHETADEYTLTVEASDGQNGTATVTVMVTVTDVAEDPSFDEVSYAFEVAEDAVVGYAVGTVSATDPDEDDEVSYSITAGDGDGKIAIDDGTGAITVAASLDHETTDAYTLTVEASDGQNGTVTVAVMVSVTDVAEDPSFDEAGYAFDVAEDASVNHTVGTVSATDPDEDDEVSYSITVGNGDGKFNIDVGTGAITVAAALDHEAADEYVLTVEADDGSGGTATVTVTVTVTDVVESPPPPPTGLAATLVEGVFTVSWTALDGTAKYEVQHRTDAADSQWTALPETTDLSVTHAPADGPVCSTEYRFRVRAYGDGDTYAEMWGVESDVEPVETATCPPEFDNASYFFFIRDTAAVNSAVGSVSATDPDQGDTLSYAITAGNGDGKFTINGTTGQLTVSGAFDIAATPAYFLTVEASDGQGGKDSAEVTVSLTIAGCYNGTAVPRADERPLLVRDCSVLLSAKDTLRGTASLNWSPDVSIDEWQGVSRANIYENHDDGTFTVTTYVKSLIVSRLGLNGSIPPVLAGLVDLRRLDLNRNQLTGEIPSELGRLSGIRNLSLSDNLLTGEIPPELGNLPILEDLRLHRNQLTGEIPSGLRRLGSLRILIFNDNRLNGSVPSWFGELSELRQLWLRDNELTGSIPSELVGLDLEHLHLSGNSLSGCIPSGLRDVANNDLDRLSLPDCTSPGNS